jgi:deoxyribodipyrimidine photo-lyase
MLTSALRHHRPLVSVVSQRHLTTNTKMGSMRPDSKVLIYLLRRDLRVSDNPIFHHLVQDKDHGFTHLLPLYVFSAKQIEVSGFIAGDEENPYPEAKSSIGRFWRCGRHRAKFLAESVWDLKEGLEGVGSGLEIRVGMLGEVVEKTLNELQDKNHVKVGAVWMTAEETAEEKEEESDVKAACENAGVEFKLWQDEKYLLDESVTSIPHTSTANTAQP